MHAEQTAAVPLFLPAAETTARSQMTDYTEHFARCTGTRFADHAAFEAQAVLRFREFWNDFLSWSRLSHSGATEPVCTGGSCETATFFPNLQLSYVENLLQAGQEGERIALTCCHESGAVETHTRQALRSKVRGLANRLLELGVEPGDRIVAIARNDAASVIGALATAAIGAVFSSTNPEMGAAAMLGRFRQLSPKVLLAHTSSATRLEPGSGAAKAAEVARGLGSLQAVILLDDAPFPDDLGLPTLRLSDILAGHDARSEVFSWPRFAFNHPLFILFSSGTTGRPKCIVHGAGGTLLEHVKEHRLHGDMGPGDTLFFHTSTAWMMWNWQLSALASGVGIVLYDGAINGPETLWSIVSAHDVTVFGASPSYLRLCQDAGYSPRRELPLPALRAVLSTGSVLHEQQFDWALEHVGAVPLQSISGGTDIIGCFVLGNPNAPVYRGESQCRSLGLDVAALRPAGSRAATSCGELVCRNPFPSRPLGFHGDPDGSRFHDAYFSQNEGVWTHGDLVEMTSHGGARLLGRSDSTLNVNGIRIGPMEIYQVLQGFPEIREAMVVEQRLPGEDRETRLVLLVVPAPRTEVDGALRAAICKRLALHASAAHVPARIAAVAELPMTHNGKRSERAARDALDRVAGSNTEALLNPACLQDICRQVEREDRLLLSPRPAAGDRAAELRAIWEGILGIRDVEADDSFFDLGGSSLMALRLCQQINDRLRVAIGPWILFHAPTLRALTLALDTRRGALSPIAPMNLEGSGRPVFLIPGMYGDVMELRSLLLRLRCARPLYGIRARGLAPGETPHETVEAIARDGLDHLRQLQPSGPYTLVGYSFGGLVAFEMARQLRRDNQEIGALLLIDTAVHEKCLGLVDRLSFRMMRPLRYLRIVADEPLVMIPELLRRFLLLRRRAPARWRRADSVMPPLLLGVARASRQAFSAYRPGPCDAPATFFLAASRWPRFCNPLPVFQRLTGGQVSVRLLPGSHNELVQEPAVTLLARALDALLSEDPPPGPDDPAANRTTPDDEAPAPEPPAASPSRAGAGVRGDGRVPGSVRA